MAGKLVVKMPVGDDRPVSGAQVELHIRTILTKTTLEGTTGAGGEVEFPNPGILYAGTVAAISCDCRVDGENLYYRGTWGANWLGQWTPSEKVCQLSETKPDSVDESFWKSIGLVIAGGAIIGAVLLGPKVLPGKKKEVRY